MSKVQVIALGGVGEIGKNCSVVRQDDDIVVIDCGLTFPNEDMLGVDIVVPDFTYIVQNKEKVRGIFITHAHEDHTGALAYLLNQVDLPVYCTEFTHALISSRLNEKLPHKKVDYRIFKLGDKIQAGALEVESIRVTHSIPENCSMAVRTEHGIILFTGDFKFDFTPVDGKLTNITRFGELGHEGVLCLMSDSTNVERPGWGPSERAVVAGLKKVFAEADGRVLLTTFASNIHRMQQLYDVAYEFGRKVAVVGRRMEQNIETCERMGYLRIPKGTRVRLEDMKLYADNQLAILTTGSQGEPMSALVQMSKGEYGRLQIRNGDTLIYSARPIPGNEAAIWRTINRLFLQGCKVIYESETPIHVSGHAYQEELKMMINLTRPYYLAPVHGEPRHQFRYQQIAGEMGYPPHRMFTMKDGVPLEFDETSANFGEAVPVGRVLVDSSGTPGVTDDVLKDRYNVAREGIVVITIPIDVTKGELAGDPILQARGFHGPDGILDQALEVVQDVLRSLTREEMKDLARVRKDAADVVRRLIQKRSNVRPLVLPTIVEV
ncbi:MAG: ribonuclease J [Fimbriimonas sp.]